jgi:hypothetical protein
LYPPDTAKRGSDETHLQAATATKALTANHAANIPEKEVTPQAPFVETGLLDIV